MGSRWMRLCPALAAMVLGGAACASRQLDERPLRLRLMSFNIRYPNPADGDDVWSNRKDVVGAFINAFHPDVLGLQEATGGQQADLDARIKGYAREGEGRAGGDHGEACVIYYRSDRFELLDHDTFWLSPTPEEPSRGWDAALNRVATWIRLKDRRGGPPFVVFNTHLDHNGEVARLKSAELILERMDEVAGSGPVILMGDFNVTDEQPPYQALVSAQGRPFGPLRDSRHSAWGRFGPQGTYVGFDGLYRPGKRIDFLFTRGPVETLFESVFAGRWDERALSDHRPVMVEVHVGAEGPR